MPPFPECAVHRMAAMKEREHRWTADSNSFEGPSDPEVASGRNHALFKGVDRFRGASGLVVDLGQVQVKLGVVHSHSQGFTAERFSVAETLLGDGSQQACIREVKRVLWSNSQGAPGML